MNAPTAEEHLGLVHLCANRFRGRGMEYEDLYSAGCIGLLKAIKAFDCTRGVQFSTYAVPVILGEIKRLFRDGGAVKVSRSLKEHAMQIQQLQEQFQQKHGRAATLTELAERSGLSEEVIAESLCAAQPPISLTTAAEEAPLEIPVPAPDTELENLFALRQVLQILPQADRKLLQYRYFQNLTQTETAKRLGISQVQVSRKEKRFYPVCDRNCCLNCIPLFCRDLSMKKWLKAFSLGHTKGGGETHGISKGDDFRHSHIGINGVKRRRKNGTAAGNSGNWQQGCTG